MTSYHDLGSYLVVTFDVAKEIGEYIPPVEVITEEPEEETPKKGKGKAKTKPKPKKSPK